MPLTQCYYHQLDSGELLLMQGTEVYIDPDVFTFEALISWASEHAICSTIEQLALTQFQHHGGLSEACSPHFIDLMNQLKFKREQWCYQTLEGLSDPATRMHDLLLSFREKCSTDRKMYFDAIALQFKKSINNELHRSVLAKDAFSLKELIAWFENHQNLLIRFQPFPMEEERIETTSRIDLMKVTDNRTMLN